MQFWIPTEHLVNAFGDIECANVIASWASRANGMVSAPGCASSATWTGYTEWSARVNLSAGLNFSREEHTYGQIVVLRASEPMRQV